MRTKYLFSITFWMCSYIVAAQHKTLLFSSIQGKQSKADSIVLATTNNIRIKADISGTTASHFKIIKTQTQVGHPYICWLRYDPPAGFTGVSTATLKLTGLPQKRFMEFVLKGFALAGLEGNNEATLADILSMLNLKTDPGWRSLAHHTRPELQGEEIKSELYEKAGSGPVTIQPVARFSPPYILPFGYYFNTPEGPALKQVGILDDSKNFHEQQTLLHALLKGGTTFDPGDERFGIYVVSPTHNSYTEDIWNQIRHPQNTGHAARVYPAKNHKGETIKNTFLICFEEASNGDYQDYVFMISNIKPLDTHSLFTRLLSPNDLSGWKIFLESKGSNNDPEKIFTIKEGVLHDIGKELGYIITEDSYTNYHFKLEFKWGEKKWPPRDNAKRDSGICYHIPDDETDKIWPRSVECQIQEGDVGDFWLLGYSTIEVSGKQNEPLQHSRMIKFAGNELQNGEWNIVEILTFGGICVHLVNGVVVNYGTNSCLRKGRILLQSEYAEIYSKTWRSGNYELQPIVRQ